MTIKTREEKQAHLRTCLGCGASQAKHKMLRVAKNSNGTAVLDLTEKHSGRGCYICYNMDCLQIAVKKNKFTRSLRIKAVSDELINEITAEILKNRS